MCHISELSDDHIDDLLAKFKAGERVTAKVLKVSPRIICKYCSAHVKKLKVNGLLTVNAFIGFELDGLVEVKVNPIYCRSSSIRLCHLLNYLGYPSESLFDNFLLTPYIYSYNLILIIVRCWCEETSCLVHSSSISSLQFSNFSRRLTKREIEFPWG